MRPLALLLVLAAAPAFADQPAPAKAPPSPAPAAAPAPPPDPCARQLADLEQARAQWGKDAARWAKLEPQMRGRVDRCREEQERSARLGAAMKGRRKQGAAQPEKPGEPLPADSTLPPWRRQ